MHPRKLLRDTVGFAAAQYLVRGLLMLRSVIAARMLSPVSYGAWNALNLVLDYGANAPFGTQQGLDQAVPPLLVDRDEAALRRLKRAGLFNILGLSALYGLVVMVYFSRRPGEVRDFWGMAGIFGAVVCAALLNLSNYHTTLLRSHGNIEAVSRWFMIQSAIGAIVGLGLIPWFGAWGLLYGWLLGSFAALLYVRIVSPPSTLVSPWPSVDSLTLVRIGLPMFLFMASTMVMRTIDRIVVLRFAGAEALGYYGIGVMVLNLLLNLPDSVSYVLYPRLLRSYREAGDDPAAIRDQALRVVRLLAIAVPLLCGMAYLLSRQAVMLWLPKYIDGTTVVRVLCFGAPGLAIATFSSIVLMTLRRQMQLLPVAAVMTVLGASLDLFVLRSGYGIDGVAWATIGTYAVYGALMLALATRGLGLRGAELWGFLLRTFVPLGVAMLLAGLLAQYLPWRGSTEPLLRVARLLIAEAAFAGIYLLAVHPLARGLGVRDTIRTLRSGGMPS